MLRTAVAVVFSTARTGDSLGTSKNVGAGDAGGQEIVNERALGFVVNEGTDDRVLGTVSGSVRSSPGGGPADARGRGG